MSPIFLFFLVAPLSFSCSELDNQGTVFFLLFFSFGGRPQLVVELNHSCEVNNL